LKWQGDHNEAAAAKWVVEAPDGCRDAPPTSPVDKGFWPGVQSEDHWPELDGIQVTMTVTEKVEEGHSTCRFSVLSLPFSP
jgi:hypothetical protein